MKEVGREDGGGRIWRKGTDMTETTVEFSYDTEAKAERAGQSIRQNNPTIEVTIKENVITMKGPTDRMLIASDMAKNFGGTGKPKT